MIRMIVDSGYFQEMSLRVVSLRLARSLSVLKANSPSSEDRSSACMEYCKLLKLQDEPVLARGRLHMVLAQYTKVPKFELQHAQKYMDIICQGLFCCGCSRGLSGEIRLLS